MSSGDSEQDYEYIRGYTGVVLVSNFQAVVLNFHYDGEPAYAMAVADVCYDKDGGIRNLYTCDSYNTDDMVYFDAILANNSKLPDTWKVGAAWTTSKPKEDVLDIYFDEDEILRLYDDCWMHESLLDGDSFIPEKDYDSEVEAIEYLIRVLRKGMCKGIISDFEEDDLEDLLDDAELPVMNYIEEHHGSVLDFVEYHPEVFHVSRNNKIFPGRNSKINRYIDFVLFDKLEAE